MVSNISANGDGTYNVQYHMVIKNTGDVTLNSLSANENLSSIFTNAGAWEFVSTADVGSTLLANSALTPGSSPSGVTNLLGAGNSLAAGASGDFYFTIKITPDTSVASTGIFNSQVSVTATSAHGQM